ncbi:MAG: glutamate racemase [Thermomicrobiales bacterium]|nr:glutamate racemase [Thermomicrobiales bacterium]MCO5218368.1 glutamate racemase [Thermomicrobiales bacterium]MCO5227089.1 glutamate racemase [Thermomicrobiales bacterium]
MTPDRNAPIGIFDSGIGGLSVWREIAAMIPAEQVRYIADSAFVPYGVRPPEEIRARSIAVAGFLIEHGVKLVVVACNTASAVAIDELRATFPQMQFVGLEPAVKPAVGMTMTGRVGVLATPRTVSGDRLRVLIEHWSDGVQVHTIAGNGMVELVEAGALGGEEVDRVIGPILDPLLAQDTDVLVLGCTHYPFLRDAIQTYVGTGVRVIDSGNAVARRTLSLLQHGHMLHERGKPGSIELFTTGDANDATRVVELITGRAMPVTHVDV